MTVLNRQVLLDVGAVSATGAWYPLDFRNDPGGTTRSFCGKLAAGDTVYLELTNEKVTSQGGNDAAVSIIVTVSAYTDALFASPIFGQWSAIRFRKTGTAGAAVIQGIM